MKKIGIFIFCFFIAIPHLLASEESLFNDKLTQGEHQRLEKGQIVIRNISDIELACLDQGKSTQSDKLLNMTQDLNPNYLAEVIYTLPYQGNETFLDQIETILADISLYTEILYDPNEDGDGVPLFPKVQPTGLFTNGNELHITSLLCMNPFDEYDSELVLERTDNSLLFYQLNLGKIQYKNIKLVSKQNMLAGISVFRYNDYWVVYAQGGVRALKLPFLRKKLEAAFINRIKDFASFYIKKVAIYR